MEPSVTWVLWNLVSVRLETVLLSLQDSVTVCTKRTIGSELFWTHQMVLLSYVGHLESRFGPFGDGVSVGAR
jgi:hypothetical protein